MSELHRLPNGTWIELPRIIAIDVHDRVPSKSLDLPPQVVVIYDGGSESGISDAPRGYYVHLKFESIGDAQAYADNLAALRNKAAATVMK